MMGSVIFAIGLLLSRVGGLDAVRDAIGGWDKIAWVQSGWDAIEAVRRGARRRCSKSPTRSSPPSSLRPS